MLFPAGSPVQSSWERLLGTPLQIIAVLVGAVVVRWLVHRAIDHSMATMRKKAEARSGPGGMGSWMLTNERSRQRAQTVGSLLKSITSVVVVVIAVLTIAAQLGIQLGPLMASAGVAGVALGFGAQSLVKDFLSGIFMMVEDQYGVGDVIDTGEAIGTVEEVSLRVTRLRDANGVIWYVRNGEIIRIANRSQGWSTALVDVPVAYNSSVERVMGVLAEVVQAFHDDEAWADKLIEVPEVAGVESVANGAATYRIIAKTQPGENFAVARQLRERSLTALDAAGIKPPPVSFGVNQAMPGGPTKP